MKLPRVVLFAILGLLNSATIAAAQPAPSKFMLGFLSESGPSASALVEALRGLGYEEGRNLTIVFRVGNSNAELPALAAELVRLHPNVLATRDTPSALALKQATAVIPIVILGVGNPIGTGLVQSLAHPGGNVTGTASNIEEWTSKRLQMITEILPGIRCLVYLRNPANPYLVAIAPAIEKVREKLQIEFQVLDAATPEQLDEALAAPIDNHCKSAVFLALDGLFVARRTQIVEFAQRNKIALFGAVRGDAEAGALMAFGFDQPERWRLGASYIDKILKGAKPADLPVQQPIKFTLVVNLRSAKGLGITVPQSILARADEVIE